MNCIRCGKTLTYNEIGLHKKLIHRGAQEFLCIECLGKHFGVSTERLEEKIRQFQEVGCTLFLPKDSSADAVPIDKVRDIK